MGFALQNLLFCPVKLIVLERKTYCFKKKGKDMKKTVMFVLLLMALLPANAQKFALIDTEYILKSIPAYAQANEQLEQAAKKYQSEVDSLNSEAKAMYAAYQKEAANLSQAEKRTRQDSILSKERQAAELKKKYFGPDGELNKKRTSLLEPIQEGIYTVVKVLSELNGYSLVLDRASDSGIIFASPRIDISDEVLAKLGYSN